MDNSYKLTNQNVLRECQFSDCSFKALANVVPNDNFCKRIYRSLSVDAEVQCSRDMSIHEVNTEKCVTKSVGINHTEGGWHNDMNQADNELKAKYLKKIEKDRSFVKTVLRLGSLMEYHILQNNAICIYEDYFEETGEENVETCSFGSTINVFKHNSPGQNRTVSGISWRPGTASHLAVAYCPSNCLSWDFRVAKDAFIWNIENSNSPDIKLHSPSATVCLEYNPKDCNVLTGGFINGQVGFWDTRKGSSLVGLSKLIDEDQASISNIKWLVSRTASEFISSSTDGRIMWWDIRKLTDPIDTFSLNGDPSTTEAMLNYCSCLEFDLSVPTKFLAGMQDGKVLLCNHQSKTASKKTVCEFQGRLGPVCFLQRNPFHPKYFLSVANWSYKVWADDYTSSPVITSGNENFGNFTNGCWSPSRPSVLLTSDIRGDVCAWSLLHSYDTPISTMEVCEDSLTCMNIQELGELLACGSQNGATYLIHMSSMLTKLQKSEKMFLLNLLEQESRKERALESTDREIKIKNTARSLDLESSAYTIYTKDDVQSMRNVEAQFWSMVNDEAVKDIKNLKTDPSDSDFDVNIS